MAEFDYSVVYKKDSKHQDADCLSHNPALHIDNVEIEEIDEVLTFTILTVKIGELQYKDKDLKELKEAILDPNTSNCRAITRRKANNFRLKDNILYNAITDKDGLVYALVIPRTLKEEVLWEAHNASTSGHMGMSKTLSTLSPKYYWDNIVKDVYKYIRVCRDCQARKGPSNRKPLGLLQSIQVGQVFDQLGIDLLVPFRKNSQGNHRGGNRLCDEICSNGSFTQRQDQWRNSCWKKYY